MANCDELQKAVLTLGCELEHLRAFVATSSLEHLRAFVATSSLFIASTEELQKGESAVCKAEAALTVLSTHLDLWCKDSADAPRDSI